MKMIKKGSCRRWDFNWVLTAEFETEGKGTGGGESYVSEKCVQKEERERERVGEKEEVDEVGVKSILFRM